MVVRCTRIFAMKYKIYETIDIYKAILVPKDTLKLRELTMKRYLLEYHI